MKRTNQLSFIRLVVALTMTTSVLAPAQPASAQLLELATGALGIINSITGKSNNSQQQQVQQQQIQQQQILQRQAQQQSQSQQTPDFSVGAGNLNGNTINLCISGCAPASTPSR